jgi:hypothetical protein
MKIRGYLRLFFIIAEVGNLDIYIFRDYFNLFL